MRPLNIKLYMCDNCFHCDPLKELIKDEAVYGFVIVDKSSLYIGLLQAGQRKRLVELDNNPPSSTRRGGQSASRLSRIRDEKYQLWRDKCATTIFKALGGLGLQAIIMAGPTSFKQTLKDDKAFDPGLKNLILEPMLDISLLREQGFQQAIDKSSGLISNSGLEQESKVLNKLQDSILRNDYKYCLGIKDCLNLLIKGGGVLDKLIVWDGLTVRRLVYQTLTETKNEVGKQEVVIYDASDDKDNIKLTTNNSTDAKSTDTKDDSINDEFKLDELKLINNEPLLDWLLEHCQDYGATLQLVSDRTDLGAQFVKGYSGCAGMLRWALDVNELE